MSDSADSGVCLSSPIYPDGVCDVKRAPLQPTNDNTTNIITTHDNKLDTLACDEEDEENNIYQIPSRPGSALSNASYSGRYPPSRAASPALVCYSPEPGGSTTFSTNAALGASVFPPRYIHITPKLPDFDCVARFCHSDTEKQQIKLVLDSLASFFDSEKESHINPDFLLLHAELTERHRRMLVDWMSCICYDWSTTPRAFHLAVMILDAFLSRRSEPVGIAEFQAIGAACLSLAIKTEGLEKEVDQIAGTCLDPFDPETMDREEWYANFQEIQDCIRHFEQEICEVLDYDFTMPTLTDYVNTFFLLGSLMEGSPFGTTRTPSVWHGQFQESYIVCLRWCDAVAHASECYKFSRGAMAAAIVLLNHMIAGDITKSIIGFDVSDITQPMRILETFANASESISLDVDPERHVHNPRIIEVLDLLDDGWNDGYVEEYDAFNTE